MSFSSSLKTVFWIAGDITLQTLVSFFLFTPVFWATLQTLMIESPSVPAGFGNLLGMYISVSIVNAILVYIRYKSVRNEILAVTIVTPFFHFLLSIGHTIPEYWIAVFASKFFNHYVILRRQKS